MAVVALATVEQLRALAGRPVVVDFFAEWCGPCKVAAPRYLEMARRHAGTAIFAKVDVDAAPELAAFAGVRAMPTFQLYDAASNLVFEMTGIDLSKLEAKLLACATEAAAQAGAAAAVPVRSLLRFEGGDFARTARALLEVSAALRAEGHAAAATDAELRALEAASAAAEATVRGGPRVPALRGDDLRQISRLTRYPPAQLFPALDALRLAVLEPHAAAHFAAEVAAADDDADAGGAAEGGAPRHTVAAVCERGLTAEAGAVCQMFALRFVCNVLASAPAGALPRGGLDLASAALEAAAAAESHASECTGTRLALSTLHLNTAVLLRAQDAGPEAKTPAICALQQLLTTPQPLPEVRLRAVLALGTLVHDDEGAADLCAGLGLDLALGELRGGAEPDAHALRAAAAHVLQKLVPSA